LLHHGKLQCDPAIARSNSAWGSAPPSESTGGGLVSTMDDYFVFYRMLLNKGRHGDAQILSRTAVELMTSGQVTPEQRLGSEMFFGDYRSWGFVVSVDIPKSDTGFRPRADPGPLPSDSPTRFLKRTVKFVRR
jgi:CubicO group peptidase (beta-lactamase class C family)